MDCSECSLSRSDLRASLFERVKFTNADLRETDLRRSSFDGCDFEGADLHGAKLTRPQADGLQLSAAQRETIAWEDAEGEEPGGG